MAQSTPQTNTLECTGVCQSLKQCSLLVVCLTERTFSVGYTCWQAAQAKSHSLQTQQLHNSCLHTNRPIRLLYTSCKKHKSCNKKQRPKTGAKTWLTLKATTRPHVVPAASGAAAQRLRQLPLALLAGHGLLLHLPLLPPQSLAVPVTLLAAARCRPPTLV